MAHKVNDIKPPKKDDYGHNKNFVWGKRKHKDGQNSAIPFIGITLGLILLFNFIALGQSLTTTTSQIASDARDGLTALETAKDKIKYNNFSEAAIYFKQAEQNFGAILKHTWFLQGDIDLPVNISKAGSLLSEAGADLSLLADELSDLPGKFIEGNRVALLGESGETPNLTKPIATALSELNAATAKVTEANQLLSKVGTSLMPSELKSRFKSGLEELNILESNLERIQKYIGSSLILLGHEVPSTILIPIQNNYELRATGGFPGSFVFVEIDNGVISEFEVHDIYDFDGQLVTSTETVPPEFAGFTKEILARDSNYTPDFAVSAARYESLLQKANGPSAENIIAIDNSVIEELLRLTGPIPIAGYDASITADNYAVVLTYLVETAQGKDVLKEFVGNFKNQLLQNPDLKKLSTIAASQAKSKHIQMFSKRPEVQSMFEEFNLAGRIIPGSGDYLLVTNSSIGGNKSDRFIKQRIIHDTAFVNSNTVQNTVTIRKFHSFTDAEEIKWRSYLNLFGITEMDPAIRHILGRGDNVNMVKVYVPANSRLVDSTSDNIITHWDPDLKLHYYLFQMDLKPGETKEVQLTYKTKLNTQEGAAHQYNLKVDNPAGDDDVIFEKRYSQISRPGFFTALRLTGNNFTPYKYFPDNFRFDKDQRYLFETELNKPVEVGVIFDL